MSRSGYTEECYGSELNLWRGAVNSAIKGKRGQKLLKELVAALDDMEVKRLVANELITTDGEFCALGVIGAHRGMKNEVSQVDPTDRSEVAKLFDISPALAAEIVFMNDEAFDYWDKETSENRWERMRHWAHSHLKGETSEVTK